MNESLPLAFAFVAGLVLSAFYFGGLWWTVRRGLLSKHPALWFFGSMLVRTSIVLVGFYVVGRGHWERLMVSLIGFVMARVLITWLPRSVVETRTRSEQEARNAP